MLGKLGLVDPWDYLDVILTKMRRQSSVRFVHSEEEEDEDQLKRLSMCFRVDISELALNRKKKFDNISRHPGGGLFGAVEDAYNQSSMSIAVPNKFFAASRSRSRSFLSGGNKFLKRSGKSFMPYDHREHNHNGNWSRERYKPDTYRKYQNVRQIKRNLVESYRCPSQLNDDHYERSYNNSPSYTQYGVWPHRKHYERECLQESFRESCPEYGCNTEYSRKGRRTKSRPGRHFEGNNNFYNAFYNYGLPSKSTNGSYKSSSQDYNASRHHLNRARNTVPRQVSGYAETDYHRDYNQFEYDNPASIYIPRSNSEWPSQENYYYSEDDDYDYNDDDREMYRAPSIQKKSVDFLHEDCEVPYNILKRSRKVKQRYEYSESQPRFQFSNVEIPYRPKKRTISSYQYDPYPKRTDSGSELCPMTYKQKPAKVYEEPWHPCRKSPQSCNPITCASHSQLWSVSQKGNRKTLKQKISGFFKGPKYKSRMSLKGCPKFMPQAGGEPTYNTNPESNNVYLENQDLGFSSKSCIVVEGTRPRCPPKPSTCGTSIRKTRCTVYPTLYREICQKKCSCVIERPKVNSSHYECEHDGHSKCSSESSRNSPDASYQDPPCVQESESVEMPSSVPSIEEVAPQEKVAFRCDGCEQPRKPNPSTINVCLTIHTEPGNLTQPPTVTAKVVESKINVDSEPLPECSCSPILSCGCSSPWPSQTNYGCKRMDSGTNCKVTILESALPTRSPSFASIENDYTSVRCNSSKCPSPNINMPKPCLAAPKSEQPRAGSKKVSAISFKNIDREDESCKRSSESRTSLKCAPYKKIANQTNCERTSCSKEPLPHGQSCKVQENCAKKPPDRTMPNNSNVEFIKHKEAICNCRTSLVQDLKKELLETLRCEQRMKAQLQFQQPTQRISLFQSWPTHLSHSHAYQPKEPWKKHWLPL